MLIILYSGNRNTNNCLLTSLGAKEKHWQDYIIFHVLTLFCFIIVKKVIKVENGDCDPCDQLSNGRVWGSIRDEANACRTL